MQVDGYSLEAQKTRIRAFAGYNNYEIVREYEDAGKSGKSIEGRKQFLQMLEDIKSGKDGISYVLVFKLSRFGRNSADVLSTLQVMQDYGVNLISVDDGTDSSKDAGKLMVSVLSAVAKMERENIRIQTMEGRRQKAREGGWNGGQAPYGYKIDKEQGGLAVEESEAELVRLIFDKYVHMPGIGYNGVAKWLNANGYQKHARQNGFYNRITATFVRGVLDNPVYVGKIAYGRSKTEKIDGTRNEYHRVKQNEYGEYDGKHEAIISEEIWQKARAKRSVNAFRREKRYSLEHAHILSGIVKCPACGAPMYGVVNRKKKKDGSGEFYSDMWYYLCKNTKTVNGKSCKFSKHYRQDDVNAQVRVVVQEALRNMDFTQSIMKIIGTNDNLETLKAERDSIESAKKKEERQKAKLLGKIMALDADDDLYDIMYEDLQSLLRERIKNISDLDTRINQISIAIENADRRTATAEEVYAIMRTVVDMMDIMPAEDERKIIHALLESVQIYQEPQENGLLVRSVRFKVPLQYNGFSAQDVVLEVGQEDENSLPNESTVETVCILSRKPQ